MSIDNTLQQLQEIQNVPAPATLLNRVEKQIVALKVSPIYSIVFTVAAVCIVCLNMYAVVVYKKTPTINIASEVASGMQLHTNNTLYHE